MRALLALILCALPLSAQIEAVCGPSPVEYSKAIFDSRTAKRVQHWSCVVTNHGMEDAAVTEAELQAFLLKRGVSALTAEAIRIGAPEIKRRGKWATIGRILGRGGMVAAALASSEIIQIGPAWGAVAGFTALQVPSIAESLSKRDPSDALFELLAMPTGVDIPIAAGRAISLNMFAAPSDVGTVSGWLVEPPKVEPAILFNRQPLTESQSDALWARARLRWSG